MKKGLTKKKRIIIIIAALILIAAYPAYKLAVGIKMSEETEPRDSWETEAGEFVKAVAENVSLYESETESSIDIWRLLPDDIENDTFNYYDSNVQDRIEEALERLKSEETYSFEAPLAVWNPYGTGSNGLYIYFEAEPGDIVEYSIHTEGLDKGDFSAQANTDAAAKEKEFLIVGLVPDMENEVELTLKAENGNVKESLVFTVTAPESVSGYPVVMETSADELSEDEAEKIDGQLTNGLYYTLGTQDYYGYMFFFDNDGVMRYEMLLDGYKADRVLEAEDGSGSIYFCVAADKIGRVNKLGKAERIYSMNGYVMHHDFTYGDEGKIIVLATKKNNMDDRVMDKVVEIDLETGNVREALDLRDIFQSYYRNTEKVTDTDTFFWQAGTRDWMHLNTIDYTEDGGVMLSSRETSSIIKIDNFDDDPELGYIIGDREFWEGTPYADSVLDKEGDFTGQYGQHTVDAIYDDSLPDGQYYIMMFNNNYYCNGTRIDDYEPVLDERVSEDLILEDDNVYSYVDVYLVDENAGTYSLSFEFAVPYSSIVSSSQYFDGNFIVNSGVVKTFGEYDTSGSLIKEFYYEGGFQGYRVMKGDFEGFWFAEASE